MIVLRCIQWTLVGIFLLVGIGSMPSVMGMYLLLMAIYVTPRKVVHAIFDDLYYRFLLAGALLFYWRYLPESDAYNAGRNLGELLQRLFFALENLQGG